MSLPHWLWHYTPLPYLSHAQHRLYWGYLLAALAVAVVYHIGTLLAKRQWQKDSPRQMLRALWVNLASRQARLDYQFWFLNTLIKVLLIAPWMLSANTVAKWVLSQSMPDFLFAARHHLAALSISQIAIFYTVVLYLASDLSRYFLHRLMHTVPILWEIHKVHHSATHLNPVTFYRVHPLENILFGLRYALVAGAVTGVFIALFGARLSLWDVAGVNALVYFFNILGANLRHSEVYLRYPSWIEGIFISPAQHQLHHQYKTSMRNYGSGLAIWDALFGSLLKSSQTAKPRKFGLSAQENPQYYSVKNLLFLPFYKIYQQLKKANTKGDEHVLHNKTTS